MTLELGRCRYF